MGTRCTGDGIQTPTTRLIDEHAKQIRRIAELEATLSEIHASTRRTTQTHEWYLDGLRHPPGVYVIMRVGPVPDGYEPTF